MAANSDHDDFGRPWGIPLWPGGPINGGVNHVEFVKQMLARRRGDVSVPKLSEVKATFAAAAKKLGVEE